MVNLTDKGRVEVYVCVVRFCSWEGAHEFVGALSASPCWCLPRPDRIDCLYTDTPSHQDTLTDRFKNDTDAGEPGRVGTIMVQPTTGRGGRSHCRLGQSGTTEATA